MTGFVVRFEGQLYGYLNQCAHVPTELDWVEGEFFEGSGLYLMCATHGAIYLPENGRCAGGPCRGGKLRAIQIKVEDGLVYWQPDEYLIGPPDLLAPQ
jgi:nitrite reductase/ring-hydroxylating ferredoxin subunit